MALNQNLSHQRLVYADCINIWGGKVHTVRKSTESLVVANKGFGLEVNVD